MRSRPQVVDVETGEALDPGQDGEICVKGPTVMKGINPAFKTTSSPITTSFPRFSTQTNHAA